MNCFQSGFNWLLVTDMQRQDAASRRMLRAGGLER